MRSFPQFWLSLCCTNATLHITLQLTVRLFLLSLPVHSGSLIRRKLIFLLNVFTALKGTHFYIIFDLVITIICNVSGDEPFVESNV